MKALVWVRWIVTVAALGALGGCFMSPSWSAGIGRYEYRYRVFLAHEAMPAMMEGPIAGEVLQQRYMPPEEVSQSFDELTKEDFKLWKVDRVADTPYCTFIFRRPLSGRFRPMKAPMEYMGVYQVQPPLDQTYFYALAPTYYGYTMVRFHGNEDPLVVDTVWDGDKLVGDANQAHHIIMLAGDGMAIAHAEEKLLPTGLDRKVYNARRIQTGKP